MRLPLRPAYPDPTACADFRAHACYRKPRESDRQEPPSGPSPSLLVRRRLGADRPSAARGPPGAEAEVASGAAPDLGAAAGAWLRKRFSAAPRTPLLAVCESRAEANTWPCLRVGAGTAERHGVRIAPVAARKVRTPHMRRRSSRSPAADWLCMPTARCVRWWIVSCDVLPALRVKRGCRRVGSDHDLASLHSYLALEALRYVVEGCAAPRWVLLAARTPRVGGWPA
jgi:hypothetical protein